MSTTVKQRVTEWRDKNPLRVARTAEGLSIFECASVLGVGQSSVQVWEAGSTTPGDEHLDAIARLAGVKTTTLMARWSKWLAERPTI